MSFKYNLGDHVRIFNFQEKCVITGRFEFTNNENTYQLENTSDNKTTKEVIETNLVPYTHNVDEFLDKFKQLCKEYRPSIYYTNADDGIRIDINNKIIFIGGIADGELDQN